MLGLQQQRFKDKEKQLSAFSMINLLKPLKNDEEHEWLYEVSATSLQRICQDLSLAYDKFFKKAAGYPKFKSRKKSKPSYPVCQDRFYFSDNSFVVIQKLGKVRYKTDFDLPCGREQKFSNPRISNVLGKWMLSFGVECENQARELTDNSLGIDLGVKDLAVAAFGDEKFVFYNINKSRCMRLLRKREKHLQRIISRKYEQNRRGNAYQKTNNISKCEEKLRKVHARIANIRHNYLHQTTHFLIELLPKEIIVEDLNVSGMMKNKHLSRAIGEQGFNEFLRQIQYKSEWNGIKFTKADRFYPSSKQCSSCGNIKHDLKLKDRTYICSECGAIIDRDYNAALNLSRYVA